MAIYKNMPMYRQTGGVIGLAGNASTSLDEATRALQAASESLGGGSGVNSPSKHLSLIHI